MFKQEYTLLGGNDEYSPNSEFMLPESQEYLVNMHETDLIGLGLLPDGGLGGGLQPAEMVIMPSEQDDTMDANTKFQIQEFPVSPRGPPQRHVFAGELDFQVEINASDTHKRKYLYSSLLNRIYVDMKTNFSVTYRWAATRAPAPLYVRSCVVFSDESQQEKRVERCTQHTHEVTNVGISPEIVKNVLHSAREKGTHGVYYCGRAGEADCWLSVLVELAAAAAGTASHAYQFVCKNSCSNGINRRAIDVIFTLEDASGHVYGRQSVGARVCACPRRDIGRDEEAEGVTRGKRRVTSHEDAARPAAPRGKKPRLDDDVAVTLPQLQVIGAKAAVTGLEVMVSMMEQAASYKRNDPQATENYNKAIANLKSQIDKLKKS